MSVIANSAPACCLASSTRASCSSDSADGWPSEKAATATAKSPRRLASSTSSLAWVRPPSVGTQSARGPSSGSPRSASTLPTPAAA